MGRRLFFGGVVAREMPTLLIVVCRVGLAAVMLPAVMRALDQGIPRDFSIWRAFFVMGPLNNTAPFSLIVWGQSRMASGLALTFGKVRDDMTPGCPEKN